MNMLQLNLKGKKAFVAGIGTTKDLDGQLPRLWPKQVLKLLLAHGHRFFACLLQRWKTENLIARAN